MTLAELLEKARDYPQNADVFAVPVDDERNRAGATLEIADVFSTSTPPIKPMFGYEKIVRFDHIRRLAKTIVRLAVKRA